MTTELIQMNKITLRCKPDCNAVLLGWHGIVNFETKEAVSWYTCSNHSCGRKFRVETEYSPKLDCMILVSHREVRR